jgi:altronate hydrolase
MQFGITNPNDNEGLMDLTSCGAHIVFLVTGRGNVVGSAVAPCIKITGNGATYARMSGDMDFDASPVLRGACTQDELALQLATMVAEVAGGTPSKSEALGHHAFHTNIRKSRSRSGVPVKNRRDFYGCFYEGADGQFRDEKLV